MGEEAREGSGKPLFGTAIIDRAEKGVYATGLCFLSGENGLP